MGMLKLLILLTFFGKQLIRKVSKLARRDEAGDARLSVSIGVVKLSL